MYRVIDGGLVMGSGVRMAVSWRILLSGGGRTADVLLNRWVLPDGRGFLFFSRLLVGKVKYGDRGRVIHFSIQS